MTSAAVPGARARLPRVEPPRESSSRLALWALAIEHQLLRPFRLACRDVRATIDEARARALGACQASSEPARPAEPATA